MDMMPEFSNFKEKLKCENLTLSIFMAVNNDNKISGKLSDEEIIRKYCRQRERERKKRATDLEDEFPGFDDETPSPVLMKNQCN